MNSLWKRISIRLGQPIELIRFLRIAIGLAGALGEVHRHGLIHKDLHPANILVDDADNVRLTGFGIASRLLCERQVPLTPEVIAGTLPYMAPEQTGRMIRSNVGPRLIRLVRRPTTRRPRRTTAFELSVRAIEEPVLAVQSPSPSSVHR